MSKNKVVAFKNSGEISADPLTELLRIGARKLITEAAEVEVQQILSQYTFLKNEQGHQQVVRNGYLPEREIQAGITNWNRTGYSKSPKDPR